MATPSEVKQLQSDNYQLLKTNRQLKQSLERTSREKSDIVSEVEMAGAMSPSAMSLPTYSGNLSNDLPFAQFIVDYEVIADSYNLNAARKATCLARALKGHAFQKYKEVIMETEALKNDFEGLKEVLTQYFDTLEGGSRFGPSDFFSRKQGDNESVVDYFATLQSLGRKAYPRERDVPDNVLLERFVRGLILPLRRVVVASDPNDPQQALERACKAQAQRLYLISEENSMPSTSPVDTQLSKQVAQLSLQVNQILESNQAPSPVSGRQSTSKPRRFSANTQHHVNAASWPQHQRHFPSPRSTSNLPPFQPRFPSRSRRQGYNQRGEIQCWYCGKYGHFQSSCNMKRSAKPQYANPQSVRVNAISTEPNSENDQVACNRPQSPSLTGSGRSLYSSPTLYLALLCLVTLAPVSDAQKPMVCHTQSRGQLFAFPRPLVCPESSKPILGTPSPATYRLYKHNLIEYVTKGWLCRGVKSTVKALTYFFNDEHLHETSTNELHVSVPTCNLMANSKTSPAGALTQTYSGGWSTNNALNWVQPGGGIECCKWQEWSVENYFLIPVTVYRKHNQPTFQCTGADLSDCDYEKGYCQLQYQSVIWTVNRTSMCEYIFSEDIPGKIIAHSWLSNDGQLALTCNSNRTVSDCGKILYLSDQGIAFQFKSRSSSRPRRQTNLEGVVMSDQLAAQLQAVYENVRREIHFAFSHSIKMNCQNMESLSLVLKSLVMSNPTLAVRTILNNTRLVARAGNGVLEIWPCYKISKAGFQILSQAYPCTQEIPIKFQYQGLSQNGFLDPLTLVVSASGTPADCSMNRYLPLKLTGLVGVYDRVSGNVTDQGFIHHLKAIMNPMVDDFDALIEPVLFKPVTMYSWQELQSGFSLNDLWETSAVQSEVISKLATFSLPSDEYDAETIATSLSENVVARGLLSFLVLLKNPFHLWVFIVCLCVNLVTVVWSVRRCFPFSRRVFKRIKGHKFSVSKRRKVIRPETKAPDPSSAIELDSLESIFERNKPISVNEINTGTNPTVVEASVNKHLVHFLFDSGSVISVISGALVHKLGLVVRPVTCPPAISVTGQPLGLSGEVTIDLKIGEVSCPNVVMRVFNDCVHDGIIGTDYMKALGPITIDMHQRKVRVGSSWVPLKGDAPLQLRLSAIETKEIPGRSMALVPCKTSFPVPADTPLLFEQALEKSDQFLCPRVVLSAASVMMVRVLNPHESPLTVYKFSTMGKVEPAMKVDSKPMSMVAASHVLPSNSNPLGDLSYDNSLLTDPQQVQMTALLSKYQHLFAQNDRDIPGTDVTEHVINVTSEVPIKQKPYRIPQAKRAEFSAKVDEMLDAGLISPSHSPWAAPVVLVTKSDGSLRPCIDFRKLNAVTVPDAYPLPRVDEALEFLSGARYLSTLDLYAGYMQVPLAETSKKYTAFISEKGLFEWNRLPFGLRNAPSTFARLMSFVLSGLLFSSAIIYLDDCLIASKTFEDHLHHIEEVFKRLERYRLKLKLKKCCFARSKLPFLGHIISAQGILPDPGNVAKLQSMEPPNSVTKVRSFLGFCNYYRRFVPNYANIARPLTNLTKKSPGRFTWTPECQVAFDALIRQVTQAPVLVYPRFDQLFIVSADASKYACGAVLSQIQEGQDHPIAYFSHTFSKAEVRYETVEKELYAVVLALKHWNHYIHGHPVLVYSDQQSLSWGIKQAESPRLMKWISKLAEFNVQIKYRPGSKQGPADFLSRLVNNESESSNPPPDKPVVSHIYPIVLANQPSDYLKTEQLKDPFLYDIIKQKLHDVPSTWSKSKKESMITQATYYDFHPRDGCLIRKVEGGHSRYVVPQQLRPRVLEECHDSPTAGHLGVARTKDLIEEKYYWPGLRNEVKNWVASCKGCATRKDPTSPNVEPLQSITASAPWQHVCLDILGPLPVSRHGFRYILVIMDHFTKWPECVPLRAQTAQTITKAFVSLVIARHGIPETIQSDQGTQFTSHLFKEVSKLLGLKQNLSCAYHPQSQGLVERFNKTLCNMLKSFVARNQKDWCVYLDVCLLAYRTTKHSSTGMSPFELQHGRQPRLPSHLLVSPNPGTPVSPHDYVQILGERLRSSYELAQANLSASSEKQKDQYDKRSRPSSLEIGDRVYIKRPSPALGLTPKLQPSWKGPFEIIDKSEPNVLLKSFSSSRAFPQWVHLNDCRIAVEREIPQYEWPSEEDSSPFPICPSPVKDNETDESQNRSILLSLESSPGSFHSPYVGDRASATTTTHLVGNGSPLVSQASPEPGYDTNAPFFQYVTRTGRVTGAPVKYSK